MNAQLDRNTAKTHLRVVGIAGNINHQCSATAKKCVSFWNVNRCVTSKTIDLLTLSGTKAPSATQCLVLAEHLRNTNMAEEKKENNNKNKKFRKQTL